MTPKEKAKDLIEKFLIAYDNEPIAIKCALIAVDEIYNSGLLIMIEDEQYWYDVKQEIEQL